MFIILFMPEILKQEKVLKKLKKQIKIAFIKHKIFVNKEIIYSQFMMDMEKMVNMFHKPAKMLSHFIFKNFFNQLIR